MYFRLLVALLVLLLTGCSTRTTVTVSGTAGSSFTGRFEHGTRVNTMEGSVPMMVELAGRLTFCELLKIEPETTLTIEIERGRSKLLHVDVPPGRKGIAAREGSPWEYEILP